MATETTLNYKALSPVKSGGKVYKVGEVIALGADEAKQLAADGIIEAKPIKAKAEKIPEGDDKTPPPGEQTGNEE
ncbi:MAG: hypothetical protein WAW36_18935 [Methylovulum miyakonense]|uniref:hypothetical protein n=1 Tax=Methylovulum miyakonense TaxID=645578 RepID=UPI003BB7A84D